MFDIIDLPNAATLHKLAERYPTLEISALETWLTLMRVAGDCMENLDRFLATRELTQRRFFVLILLLRNPEGLSISQLAKGTGVSCPTMTGVVDGLCKGQLVTRETSDHDRRAFVVKITPAGQTLLDEVLPAHYRRVSAIMAGLSNTERNQLQVLLTKARAGLVATTR